MANNQDAKPFVELKKDAEEFEEKFNEDIEECLNFLDSKITALICDPDSLGDPARDVRHNTLVEFSKAKYDVFMSVKNLISTKEREWLNYISEMKKLFIENVEIFLAGTKLEVKLPSSEFQPSPVEEEMQSNRKGRPCATSIKLSNPPMFIHEATEDIEMDTDEADLEVPEKNVPISQVQKTVSVSKPARGRQTKQSVQNGKLHDELQVENAGSEDEESSSASDQIVDSLHPSTKKLSGRRSTLKKAADLQKTNHCSEVIEETKEVETSVNQIKGRRGRPGTKNRVNNSIENQTADDTVAVNEKESTVEIVSAKTRRGRSTASKNSDNSIPEKQTSNGTVAVNEKEPTVEIVSAKTRRGRSTASKNSDSSIPDEIVITRTPARGRKGAKTVIESVESVSLHKKNYLTSSDEHSKPGTSKSPGKVTFTTEADIHDDLEIYSPVTRPAKSSSRRKTLYPNLKDASGFDDVIQENPTRGKSKRKTIGGVSELGSATPSKRLKFSTQKGISSVQEEAIVDDNLLESDDNYSDWMALKNVDGKIPTLPAIYEVKVWRAKKPAYIGFCESLRQKLTLYKLRQNSGHKHLDKFVDRNYDDIQIRYEVVSSADDAKRGVKSRVDNFVGQYKTTPAYN